MQRPSTLCTSLVALLGFLVLPPLAPAGAQEGPAPTWIRVDTVQVKPEMWTAYRAIERDEVIPALRKGGVRYRAAWRTAEFGDAYELLLIRPIDDFAAYDAGDSFSSLGPREAERLREQLRRCIQGRVTTALLQRPDLGVAEAGLPFAVVTTVNVATGQGVAYEAFLRNTLPGAKKAGVAFGVYQRVYGRQTAWLLVENLPGLGELARPGGLFRAFGQESADRLIGGLEGIVDSVERKVIRYDPELSFTSQEGTGQRRR